MKQGLLIFFQVYYYIILGRILLSLVQAGNLGNPALSSLYRIFYGLTEPLLAPIRRVLPPVRWGTAYMDLSPLVLFFLMVLVRNLLISYL